MTLQQWMALARLGRHALKLGLHHFVDVDELPTGLGKRLLAIMQRLFPAPADDQAARLCSTVESLGRFTLLGQLLSTRPDLLPAAIVQALTKLQDEVDPIEAFLLPRP